MPIVRNIVTRAVFEGDAQYKQAVRELTAGYNVLRSEMAKVESQYKGAANSMEALAAKGKVLEDMYHNQEQRVSVLGGALADAQKAQQAYVDRAEKAAEQIAALNAQMERLKSTSGDTSAEQEELAAKLSELNKELSEAQKGQSAAAISAANYQKQLNYTERDLNNLSGEIKDNNKYLAEAEKSVDGCAQSIDEYGKKTKEAAEDADEFGKKSSDAVNTLASALAAAGVAATLKEIAQAIQECTDNAVAFEKGMAAVFTLLPELSQNAREKMSEDLMRFSSDMGVMAESAIASLNEAISSDVPPENVFTFLEAAQKSAVGGVTDLETAVDGLTSVVNAYGTDVIDATTVSNIMFETVKYGKTSFEELSKELYKVTPLASSAQISFENIGGALATITAQGTPVSVAATQLNKLFSELTQSGTKASDIFKEIAGKSFKEFIASGRNVQDALVMLERHAGDSGLGINDLFSSIQAGQAAMSLTGTATEKFAGDLKAMENAAGSVDKAYSEMADTTDFAMQRAAVAFDNMKTAIGNEFKPALEDLAEAGEDAFAWVTDFVEEHPEAVKGITAVIAVVGVFSIAVAGSAAAIKIATIAQNLWNASMAANPLGLMVIAVGAFSAALNVLLDTTNETVDATNDLIESIQESRKEYQKKVAAIEEEKENVAALVGTLIELEDKEKKTAADKSTILGVVNDLNEAIPELTLAYDEQTGALSMTVEKIEEMAAAHYKERDIAIAQQSLTQAYLDRYAALEKIEEIQKELDAHDDMTFLQSIRFDSIIDYQSLLQARKAAQDELSKLDEDIEKFSEKVQAHADEINEANKSVAGQASATYSTMIEDIAALGRSYEDAYKVASAAIDKQIGLYSKISNEQAISTEEVGKNLDSQINALTTYSQNIQRLRDMNIENIDLLLGRVSDFSDDSIAFVNNLFTTTELVDGELRHLSAKTMETVEGEVRGIVDKIVQVEGLQERTSDVIARTLVDFDNELNAIHERADRFTLEMNTKDAMTQIGKDAMLGYIQGIESQLDPLRKQMDRIAKVTLAATKETLDQNSPSKKFMQIGRDMIEGQIIGIEQMKGKLEEAVARDQIAAMRIAQVQSAPNITTVNNTATAPSSTTYHQTTQHISINADNVRSFARLVDMAQSEGTQIRKGVIYGH